jgi:hypothetical protein
MPAAPTRRLDAGAIGSLSGDYPLLLVPPADQRVLDTVDYLLQNCCVSGGFFQDMIHSGINVYLSLHIAQVLLRAGDHRYLDLIETVAALASPTGQWPEAIHPGTRGGCMGDGQHGWASAEWILMLRNCFVREEPPRLLILASGIAPSWLDQSGNIAIHRAYTTFGMISVSVTGDRATPCVNWHADWHAAPAEIRIALPGYVPVSTTDAAGSISLVRQQQS